jgi:hypothetical protein
MNTVVFILGATVVNMVLMIALFLLTFVLFGIFIAPRLPPAVNSVFILVLFVLSVVGTYFVYHKIVAFLSTRVELEKYFDPIFKSKKKRR